MAGSTWASAMRTVMASLHRDAARVPALRANAWNAGSRAMAVAQGAPLSRNDA